MARRANFAQQHFLWPGFDTGGPVFAGREMEIVQFVPLANVDPVYFVASYLLAGGSVSAKA
jgi:non-homologous end joining protein Ku